MKRPKRTVISTKNLTLIGVPKKFHLLSMSDFNTYGRNDLVAVKQYIEQYLLNIASNFDNNFGIYLYGSNGVGKTFIACMVVKEAYVNRYTAQRVTFIEYVNAYTKMWGSHSPQEKEYLEQEFYNRYKSVEFLVIEEVGKEIDSKISAPILEDCLRYREDHGLVTIICTNLTLTSIQEKYGASVFSLMQGNMTPIKIEGKDKRREYFDKE